MDQGRERGFIVLHRKIRSSALYRSMTGEQRIVLVTVLLLANWGPATIQYAGKWVTIERGEFFHSLETVAAEAGVSVKVVRTAYAKMLEDDSHVGGCGSFLEMRWTGTETGRGLRVLRVRNYSKYQTVEEERGTETGTTRARRGHDEGTTRAAREQDQPEEPEEPERDGAREAHASTSPSELLSRLADEFQATRGSVYGWTSVGARKADLEASAAVLQAAGGDVEEVVFRWVSALLHEGFPRVDTVADLGRFWPRFSLSPAAAKQRAASRERDRQERENDEERRLLQQERDRKAHEGGAA